MQNRINWLYKYRRKKSDVVNNLTTTTTNVPLSANQGKELASKINLISGTDTSQLESKLKEYVDSLISEALEGEY